MRISQRHFIKEAAAIQDFIQAIINKYSLDPKNEPDLGRITSKFFQHKGIKSIPKNSDEFQAVLNSLPEIWEAAKIYMKSETDASLRDPKKEALIDLGLAAEDISNSEIRDWLYDRYIEKNKKEIHPIEDALPTLKDYILNKQSIITMCKENNNFLEQIKNKGISPESLNTPNDLSIDNMVFLFGQYKYGSKTSINTFNVQPKTEEFVAKVGEWSVWLPSSQETSAKIAGYNEETKEPYTTWCTARTKGSNLFYHYISRGAVISFLFYIIKDDPSEVNDWLSLGVVGDTKDPINSLKFFFGKDGGLTVNRDNAGLKESDFQQILGDKWGQISSIVMNKIKELGYKNPATESLRPYESDYDLFYRALKNKSYEERKGFCNIILDLNPVEKVSNLAKKLNNYEYYILREYIDDPEIKPFISSTAYSYAQREPYNLLYSFSNEKWAKEHIDKAAKECMKRKGERFSEIFIIKGDEPWAKPYLNEAIEGVSSTNPGLILQNSEKEWAKDYISRCAKNMVEYDPYRFLYLNVDKPWAKDYIETAVKNTMKNNDTVNLFGFYKVNKSPLLEPFMPLIAKTVAEEDPLYFLRSYVDEPELSSGIPIAFEILVNENTARDTLSSLSYHNILFNNPLFEPYIEDIAKKCVEETPGEFIVLFKDKNWAKKYLPLAAEALANKEPATFLRNYSNKDFGKPYLEIAKENILNQDLFELLSDENNYFTKDILSKLAKKLLELGYNNGNNIGYFSDKYWAKEKRDELGGKSFLDLYNEQEERREQEENNNTEDKITTLSKALRSMGLIKEAATLRLLY